MQTRPMKEISLLVLVFLCFSCSSKLDKEEYISWFREEANGLHQKRSINSTTVEVQYADSSYQIAKANTKEPMAHVFYIHLFNETNRENFASTANDNYSYFSFGFEKDVYVQVKDKIYPCDLLHYEQSHGKLGELYFIAGFELHDIDKNQPIQLVLNPQPFQTGPIKFTFDLSKLPLLSDR